MTKALPLISVVTPTLNAGKVLERELNSIRSQNYPQERIEIIIADGGSTDDTLHIAEKFHAKVYPNPLKTGEAGKAVGVKKAKGEYIALIDSDNILPTEDWFTTMIEPLRENRDIVGAEPWSYTYRKEGGFIERYCALIGMNDPIVLWYGNYDRVNTVSEQWTDVPIKQKNHGNWIEILLEKNSAVPTIGANGTIFRASFLQKADIGNYLFDIDILADEVQKKPPVRFAKVKIGIIHTFCESSIAKFSRKQRRRVLDYYFYKDLKLRRINWNGNVQQKNSIVRFGIDTVLLIPLFYYALKGYRKKRDAAWFFHPLACVITLWQYSIGTARFMISKKQENRSNWKQ